jgi:hypothetical protein
MSLKMLLLSSSFSSRANLAVTLISACLATTTRAMAEDSFPQTPARAEVLRWLAGNSDLNANAVVAMTDEVVVAITERQDGRGLQGSTRLTLREEVISPDAAATWGGRSIQLDVDLDCSRHRVMLGVRRIYARPNLQGSVRLTRSDAAWTEAPPGTVIDEVVRGVCAPQPPAQLAAAQTAPPAPPVQTAAVEPPPAADAPPAEAAAPAPPAPVRTAAADTAPAPPPQTSDAPPVAAQPPRPTQVAAADPPAAPAAPAETSAEPGTARAAPADQSVVLHNPFAAPAARISAPAAKPAARTAEAAIPAPHPAEFAVQIATVASADLAMGRWQSLKARLPDLVAPRTFAVEPVSDNGRTLYRALLLGFSSPDDAAALCKALRGQSVECTLRQLK